MPSYLLKPEPLSILVTKTNPTYRWVVDLMRTVDTHVSEVLALTRANLIDNGYDLGVELKPPYMPPSNGRWRAVQRHRAYICARFNCYKLIMMGLAISCLSGML